MAPTTDCLPPPFRTNRRTTMNTTTATPTGIAMPEVYRSRRGHCFYPTPAQAREIPALYAQDSKGDRAIVHLHYFNSSSDWFITELDPETGVAFGFAIVGGDWQMAELGYTDINALESLSGRFGLLVERDLYFTKTTLGEIRAEQARRYGA